MADREPSTALASGAGGCFYDAHFVGLSGCGVTVPKLDRHAERDWRVIHAWGNGGVSQRRDEGTAVVEAPRGALRGNARLKLCCEANTANLLAPQRRSHFLRKLFREYNFGIPKGI
jgi:hypothetical protein